MTEVLTCRWEMAFCQECSAPTVLSKPTPAGCVSSEALRWVSLQSWAANKRTHSLLSRSVVRVAGKPAPRGVWEPIRCGHPGTETTCWKAARPKTEAQQREGSSAAPLMVLLA